MTKLLAGAARLRARIRHSRALGVLIACLALTSLCFAGASLAGPEPARDPGPGPAAFRQPEVQQGLQRAREREERRARDRATPEAREERGRSRTAYRGQSRADAIALSRAKFGDIFTRPLWTPLRLLPGDAVEDYRDDYSALVSTAGGKKLLAVSMLPLRARTEQGDLAPVSLELRDRGDAFVPENPLIDLRIAKDPARGVKFERGGFSFALEGAGAGVPAEAPVLSDGRAFFANVLSDTDLLVQPMPTGVETFLTLRSEASPETASFTFDLPPGASLRRGSGADRTIEIVRGDRLLGFVDAPAASDADGEPVPVSADIDGQKVVLRFPHRGGDYAYPLVVDPIVGDHVKENFNLDGNGGATTGTTPGQTNDPFAGWSFVESRANYFPHFASTTTSNRGLTVYAYSGVTYNDNDYGEWLWQAPRAGSFIERADFGYVTTTNRQGTCTIEGIFTPAGNWDYGVWYENNGTSGSSPTLRSGEACSDLWNNYKAHCVGADCNPNGTRRNMMVFGMLKFGTAMLTTYPTHRMEGATIWLYDYDTPVLTAVNPSGVPSGWTRNASFSVTVSAQEPEPGLGLHRFRFKRNGANYKDLFYPCEGDRNVTGYCPTSWSTTYTASTEAGADLLIPEGVSNFSVAPVDAVSKEGAPSSPWTVRVDRTGPAVSLSGPLTQAPNGIVGGETALQITASDGDAANPQSGVRSIEVLVDGQRADYAEQSAGDNASMSHTFTFRSADYDPGPRKIEVIATDQAGNRTSPPQEVTVTNDNLEPFADFDGSLWDNEGVVLSQGSYDLSIDAFDGDTDIDAPESGVKSIEILVDGQRAFFDSQPCASGSCGMTRAWQFRPDVYPDGERQIDIRVTDQVGNVFEESFSVTVDKPDSPAPQTMSASTEPSGPRLDGGATSQTGSGASTLGDINGDELDDYVVGAPGADNNGRTDSGSAYVIYGKGSDTPLDLAGLTASDGFRIDGAVTSERAGTSVAPAGDVNGDGRGDILIGAPGSGSTIGATSTTPRVYVVFGSSQATNVDLAALGTRGFRIERPTSVGLAAPGTAIGVNLKGPRPGDFATSADVNGDGLDDVVIGSPYEGNNARAESGSTYVVFGKADNLTVDLTNLGSRGFRIDGEAAGNNAGKAATPAGDINGDGLADVLLSAPDAAAGRTATGSAYVVFGREGTLPVDLLLLGTQGFRIQGAADDRLGSSVAALGDVDGDDLDDYAVSGYGGYVLFGREAQGPIDLATSAYPGYRLLPPGSVTLHANSVISGTGDVSNDGVPDVAIGFPSASPRDIVNEGAAYVVFTDLASLTNVDLASLPGDRGARVLGGTPNARLGASVDGADFVRPDAAGLIAGAPGAVNNTRLDSGSAYVVRSSAMSGANPSPQVAATSTGERRDRNNCYRSRTPAYTYTTFQHHPSCRRTHGAPPSAPAAGSTFERATHRTRRYGNGRRFPKRIRGGRWSLLDSLGNKVAEIQQTRYEWVVYNAAGDPIARSGRGRGKLQVQGRGCMKTENLESRYALVSVQVGGTGLGSNGADMGVRGFLERGAFPDGAFHRANPNDPRDNDRVIDRYTSGCGRSPYRNQRSVAVESFQKVLFDRESDRYQGHLREQQCRDRTSPNCGGFYRDYTRPNFEPSVLPLSQSTTGVRAGGIARAVIRTSNFRILDQIDYVDQNVPCQRSYVAQWIFGDANPHAGLDATRSPDGVDHRGENHIYGWIPVKRDPTGSRSC